MRAENVNPEPASAGPEVDLRAYWEVVVKRRWTIAAFLAAVVGVTTVATLRQTRIYQASASVIIDLALPQVLGQQNVQEVADVGATWWYSKEYFLTQYKVITSRAVSALVVNKLRLGEDDVLLGIAALPPAERERARLRIDPIDRLRARVRVDPVKDSRMVMIRAEDPDPARAQLYANAVADAYIQYNLSNRIDATQNAGDWLEDQIQGLRSKLEASELAVFEFKKAHDMLSTSLEDRQNIVSQRLLTLNETLTRHRARRAELEARATQIDALAGPSATADSPESLPPVLQNPVIQQLKLKFADAAAEFGEVSDRYLPDHPRFIALRRKLDAAQTNLRREAERLLAGTRIELKETLETERSLAAMIEATKSEAFDVNKKDIDYKRLAREEENNRRLYDLVLKRLKETDLSSMLRNNNIRLLDAATRPTVPVRPRVQLNLVIALLCGLFGGIGLAFVLEQFDTTVQGQEDIERVLGVTFLGIVPSIHEESERARNRLPEEALLKNRDRHIETHPRSSVAECCRTIRTSLLFMTPDRPLRKILVFSSSPQEGKTTTAVNLAITMAQGGQRTLLVDSDMRRPRLHKTFQVPSGVGLSTAILDEAAIDDAIKTTDVSNLFVLPCGPIPPNPTELLHAASFERVVEGLARRFDRLIFDSPPALAVADAAVLARVMDGALMVVKAGRTHKPLAQRTVQLLRDARVNVLGAILNDLDVTKRGYGYYAYYYRGGYYYAAEPAETSPPAAKRS